MKFLWLYPGSELIFQQPLFKKALGFQTLHHEAFFSQPLADRTGVFDLYGQHLKFDLSVYPIPQLEYTNLSLEDLCIEQAQKILAQSLACDNPICLFYSGGVDSTSVLCSFILAAGLAQCQDQIILCMDDNSIAENLEFYQQFIDNKFATVNTQDLIYGHDHRFYDCIFVSGDPNLFGAFGPLNRIKKETPSIDFYSKNQLMSNLKLFYQHTCSYFGLDLDQTVEEYLSWVTRTAAVHQVEIENFFEFKWWSNFNFRYYNQSFWMLSNLGPVLTSRPYGAAYWQKHFIPFFASEKFQLWEYSHRHDNYHYVLQGPSAKSYKVHQKSIINKVFKNNNYRLNKGKQASLKNGSFRTIYAIDENYRVIPHDPARSYF